MKNAHYAIAAQVPWSIWAALALARIGERLRRRGWHRRGCAPPRGVDLLRWRWSTARVSGWSRHGSTVAESNGASTSRSAGRCPRRRRWHFLYDEWDRLPYECPFGSFPHDLAVRLFYLGRPACWHLGTDTLLECSHAAVGRPRRGVAGSRRRRGVPLGLGQPTLRSSGARTTCPRSRNWAGSRSSPADRRFVQIAATGCFGSRQDLTTGMLAQSGRREWGTEPPRYQDALRSGTIRRGSRWEQTGLTRMLHKTAVDAGRVDRRLRTSGRTAPSEIAKDDTIADLLDRLGAVSARLGFGCGLLLARRPSVTSSPFTTVKIGSSSWSMAHSWKR